MKIYNLILIILSLILLSCSQQAQVIEQDNSLDLDKLKSELIAKNYSIDSATTLDPYLPLLKNSDFSRIQVSVSLYRKGQAPGVKNPSKDQIIEDLYIIAEHFDIIRLYNADAVSKMILETIRAEQLPLKVMLGVWLGKEDSEEKRLENINNVVEAIRQTNEYNEEIFAVSVGNETQVYWSWHKMKIDSLIKYIKVIRSNVNKPISTADDYNFWNKEESKKVAQEIDFITCHIHPLWNGKSLENSMEWVDSELVKIQELHPEKQLVVGEIGWASNYNANKKGDGQQGTLIKGKADVETQGKFLQELATWTKKNKRLTFLFEVFDEPWKGGGDSTGSNEVEKNWGIFYENRKPKQSFIDYTRKIKDTNFGG